MATYDVQVFRVVKLTFVNIDAPRAEEAAMLADAKARDVTDCIVATQAPRTPPSVEMLPPGSLASVGDAHVNTEFVVNQVRRGVAGQEDRCIRTHRFVPAPPMQAARADL